MTVREAADTIEMSTGFVYRAIRSGELAVSRFGRSVRIEAADLQRYRDRARGRPVGRVGTISLKHIRS